MLVTFVNISKSYTGVGQNWFGFLLFLLRGRYSQIDPLAQDFQELAREAQMLGQLRHKHILPFLGLCAATESSSGDGRQQEGDGEEIRSLVLVTPWCPVTLRTWIDQDPGTFVDLFCAFKRHCGELKCESGVS